jgi:hypothetical protein
MIARRRGGYGRPAPFHSSSPAVAPGFVFLETRHDRLVRPLRLRSRGQAALPHCRTRAVAPVGGNASLSTQIVRSPLNLGGIAVSGEITLRHDDVYIQVCQPASGADSGILIRTCQGRRDYTGDRNHLAPLRLLDDAPTLAAHVRAIMATKTSAFCGTVLAAGAGPASLTRRFGTQSAAP